MFQQRMANVIQQTAKPWRVLVCAPSLTHKERVRDTDLCKQPKAYNPTFFLENLQIKVRKQRGLQKRGALGPFQQGSIY